MRGAHWLELAAAALFVSCAYGQSGVGETMSPEALAKIAAQAEHFEPPRLTRYAARLARQPDLTGTWAPIALAGARILSFDPAHSVAPPALPEGEARFGPLPGTYIKGIPYNARYQKKYQELIKETTEGKSRDNFPACFPYGVPRMIGDSPVPFDIIQSPDVMIWYNNYGRTERRIFLGQSKHEIHGNPETGGTGPSYSGDSIGHWEGNTLIVDTVNMVAGYFDETPAPYSDQLHMVERIRLIATNVLEDQMTFTDPVTLTRPWVVTRYFWRGRQENDVGPDGAEIHPRQGPSTDNSGVPRYYSSLSDRPCVPNVRMDANGFQVTLQPQELSAPPPPKP